MASIRYSLKIEDYPGEPFLISASWDDEAGRWVKTVPVLRKAVEYANNDLIGWHIEELEKRIAELNPGTKIILHKLVLPEGWFSHHGPDSMIRRRENRMRLGQMTRIGEENGEY